jgi:UDP-N-acetylmuramyl pentapeptide phosphotransferase/UDP-N-acetylglucosamine-1-phosphate transferase
MFDFYSVTNIALIFIITFLATFIATPAVAKLMKQHGITGEDVHKLSKVKIPEMCGLAILFGLTIGITAYVALRPSAVREAVAFLGTVLIAGGIGIVDDLRPLGARLKPLLTAAACLPILILGTYVPDPVIPLIGPVRLTLVYPILIPIAIAITSNGINMMDIMNGSMPGTVAIIAAAATAVLLISGDLQTASLAAGLLAAMLAFYYFNRFPSRVFDGDTGSLAVGAALGALSILGRIETVMIVAMIPHIMNAFYGLASVGGLRERREIHQRPIRLLDNGLLKASTEKGAPVTLARLILAEGPLGERDIVKGMMILTAVSSCLALLTYLIMVAVRL